MLKNTAGVLALSMAAGCAATATMTPTNWMDAAEQAIAAGASLWAVLRFVFTPLLAQMVRKAIHVEVQRLEALHTAHADLDSRMHHLEGQVAENTRMIRDIPRLQEALSDTKRAVENLNGLLTSLLETTTDHAREIGHLHGYHDGAEKWAGKRVTRSEDESE